MPSVTARSLSRTGRSGVVLGSAWFVVLASCAPTEPSGSKNAPVVNAHVSSASERNFYVSPTGSPSGDGSFANPWDLASALDGPAAVTPGSTIWLRGGWYANGPYFGHGYLSNLTGTADAPIVVRQYPGERATVTKFLVVRGAFTWYWGFEVVHPPPHVGDVHGVAVQGPGIKLINLVVHDASLSGIIIWPEASDAEVYGAIAYNNGRNDNFDHGIYCQSQTSNLLKDNIVFANWALGIHCFSETGPYLQNIHLEGNVAFNNSVWGVPRPDILVGGEYPASRITLDRNYTYRTDPSEIAVADVGWDFVVGDDGVLTNEDVVVTDNYFVGGWIHVSAWVRAIVTGNTLFNFTNGGMLWNRGDLSGHAWSGNTFFGDPAAVAWRYSSDGNTVTTTFDGWRTVTGLVDPGTYAGRAPAGVRVVVRPNQYESGRATIIVYNWDHESTVNVDLSAILEVGDRYVVQNAQDFYGLPAAGGVYTGGSVELPLVGITPPVPLGIAPTEPVPVTGPTFNVFIVTKTRPARGPCPPVSDVNPAGCDVGPERHARASSIRGHRPR